MIDHWVAICDCDDDVHYDDFNLVDDDEDDDVNRERSGLYKMEYARPGICCIFTN